MKKKLYLAAAFCMIIATGCTNNKKSANSDNVVADTMQVADMHNAETSLDYFGEYKGTIPAADCPGIEVTLIFNKDRTYTQKYIYLERKDGEFNETGTFKVEGNILTATSKNGVLQGGGEPGAQARCRQTTHYRGTCRHVRIETGKSILTSRLRHLMCARQLSRIYYNVPCFNCSANRSIRCNTSGIFIFCGQ